jgi:hypothetical protein
MNQIIEEICRAGACQFGCTPDTGCQGHAARAMGPELIAMQANQLVEDAARLGVVVTIEQQPLLPLAMGHYETVVSVRRVRGWL